MAGLVAGGGIAALVAVFGLASALGWDVSGGSSDNRGIGTPLSREEVASLLLNSANQPVDDNCTVVVGQPLSRRCQELQEEERALWGVVTGTDLRAK